ncbi:hypothetical protein Tco_0658129 [Tanacetum coccineum]
MGTMWCLFDPTPSGSISTWEDLTTSFLAQFFPPGRTSKLCNDILMFQQHQEEEPKDASPREHEGPTNVGKIKPSWMKDEIRGGEIRKNGEVEKKGEWLDIEEPIDLVDTGEESVYESLIKEMPRAMSYVMDFTILENIEANIDPNWSYVIFGRPCIEKACLAINRKHGLMTFTNGIREVTFKTPYKDQERSELTSEGHDLLSSRVILSEDDYDRGCRKPSDLEDGFYKDTVRLRP